VVHAAPGAHRRLLQRPETRRRLAGIPDARPAVGGIVSFLSALLVIRALIRFVSHHDFRGFAWYRIAFGLVIIAFYWNASWTG
jgi:undecaprenyl-diphosphatase